MMTAAKQIGSTCGFCIVVNQEVLTLQTSLVAGSRSHQAKNSKKHFHRHLSSAEFDRLANKCPGKKLQLFANPAQVIAVDS
jgi:hypothetical protein